MTKLTHDYPEYTKGEGGSGEGTIPGAVWGTGAGGPSTLQPMDPEPTLWDYYAMAALQGVLAGGRGTDSVYANCEFDDCETASDEFATIAAHAADAMMKVRQKISK